VTGSSYSSFIQSISKPSAVEQADYQIGTIHAYQAEESDYEKGVNLNLFSP
jgi:hypothetical protein